VSTLPLQKRFHFLLRGRGEGIESKVWDFFTDHVQVTAISRALRLNVKIAYLDGRSNDGRVEFVTFNNAVDETETPLTLIYRWVDASGQGPLATVSERLSLDPVTMTYWTDAVLNHCPSTLEGEAVFEGAITCFTNSHLVVSFLYASEARIYGICRIFVSLYEPKLWSIKVTEGIQ
jgi:hypothetical protein